VNAKTTIMKAWRGFISGAIVPIDRLRATHDLLLVALALIALGSTLRVGFMLDDAFLLPRLKPAWTAANIQSDFTSNVHDEPTGHLYRPLLKMMIRAQHSLSEENPAGYHAVSLFFHAMNGPLFARLALAVGCSPLCGLVVGSLFAVHPLIVDDLLAATGGESLSIFLILGSLILLSRRSRTAYAGGILLYILAVLAKESAVMIPFVLALMFYVTRRPKSDYRRVVPLLLLWIPYGILWAQAISTVQGLTPSLAARFCFMAFPKVTLYSIFRVIFPWGLDSWPHVPALSRLWPVYLVGEGILLAWLIRRQKRWELFYVGWVLLWLAPRVPAIILGNAIFDKWMSLASWGVLLPLSAALSKGMVSENPRAKRVSVMLWGGVLVFWLGLSQWNVAVRGSDEKNYLWAMRDGPRDFAEFRLGVIYLRTGRAAQAIRYLEDLHRTYPANPDYSNALALAYWHSGRKREGVGLLEALVHQRPDYDAARENLKMMKKKGASKGGF
jgi:hypothetical protein